VCWGQGWGWGLGWGVEASGLCLRGEEEVLKVSMVLRVLSLVVRVGLLKGY